jgi:hypothetical protein
MNKSLEKIRDEFAKEQYEIFNAPDVRINEECTQEYITGIYEGFDKAISTLKCVDCKHSEPCGGDGFYCFGYGLVEKDYGCIEFEERRTGNE